MRFNLDPLAAIQADGEDKINRFYNDLAFRSIHLDQEHAIKRAEALAIMSGSQPAATFSVAAELESISAQDLARSIIAKSDDVMLRANKRRALVLQVRAATSQEEISAILAHGGIVYQINGVIAA